MLITNIHLTFQEYEYVYHDGLTLREMMSSEVTRQREEKESQVNWEAEIDAKLVKQEEEMKKWKMRIETKNKTAERERLKKERIMAEVRGFIMLSKGQKYERSIFNVL